MIQQILTLGEDVFTANQSGQVLIYANGEIVRTVETPVRFVSAVGRGATGLLLGGYGDQGPMVAAEAADGSWEWYRAGSGRQPALGFGGGIIAVNTQDVGDVSFESTSDGQSWKEIDAVGIGGYQGGAPFLIDRYRDSATTITLLDRWPGRQKIDVPSRDPLEAVRVGPIIRVRGSDGIWQTRDEGVTWSAFTTGIERGFTGPARLVPTEAVAVLVAGSEAFEFLTFQP
jgi:hypothetical protein